MSSGNVDLLLLWLDMGMGTVVKSQDPHVAIYSHTHFLHLDYIEHIKNTF